MDELDYMAGCAGHLSHLAALSAELAAPTTYCPAFAGHPHPGLSHGFGGGAEDYDKDELGHGSNPRGAGGGGHLDPEPQQHFPPLMLPAAPSVDPDEVFGAPAPAGKRHQTERRPGARVSGGTATPPPNAPSALAPPPAGPESELTESSPEWQDFLRKRQEAVNRPAPGPAAPPPASDAESRFRQIVQAGMAGDTSHSFKEMQDLENQLGPDRAESIREEMWAQGPYSKRNRGRSKKVNNERQNQYADPSARWRGPGQDPAAYANSYYSDLPSAHTDLSPEKARKILHDGTAQGHPLTEKQRGFFGAVAGHGTHNSAYAAYEPGPPSGFTPEPYAEHRIRMDDREWDEWKRRHPESVAPYSAYATADPYPHAYAANAGHTAECGQCGQKFYVHTDEDNAVCPRCGASSVSYRMPMPAPDDDDMVTACRYMADTMDYCSYAVAPGFTPPPAEPTPAEYAAYGYYAAYNEFVSDQPGGVPSKGSGAWHRTGVQD